MSTKWYYQFHGGQIGPIDSDEIDRLIFSGKLGPGDRVRDRESDLWLAVQRVPRFSSHFTDRDRRREEDAKAAALEAERNAAKKKRQRLAARRKKTVQASSAADELFDGVTEGDFDGPAERARKPILKRRSVQFLLVSVAVISLSAAGWGSLIQYRRSSNRSAYEQTVILLDEMEQAAAVGIDSPEWASLRSEFVDRRDRIAADVYHSQVFDPGYFILDALRSATEAMQVTTTGNDPQKLIRRSKERLSYASFAFGRKIDRLLEYR
ncbi:GYF domain-containing protein [Stratiformator vulcanicus]|uniref:GYF domain-containing protein n=1 Tax=Stratiformator vulcanicus TaxID=2527980 RepID=A0A517R5D0_9PLAN|nr:GYF domain-containing protein [Stratiformator vulcanicus]QDT39033.1 hypothetical protein Pan189_34340 [Stratiformator vulcanicus]